MSSLGEDFDAFLEGNFKSVIKVSSHQQLYQMLEYGRIDFTADGLYPGLITLKRFGFENIIIPLETPINTEYLYAPISKKSRYQKYMSQYEAGLEKLRTNKTIERLVDKYMKSYTTSVKQK